MTIPPPPAPADDVEAMAQWHDDRAAGYRISFGLMGSTERAEKHEATAALIRRQQAEIARLTRALDYDGVGYSAEQYRRLRSRLERCEAALRAMLETHGKPHREEWINDAGFEHAKSVDAQARAYFREQEQP